MAAVTIYTLGDPKYFQVWVGFAVGPGCRTSGLAVWTTWSSKPYNIGGICGGTCLRLKLPKWRCLAPLPHACVFGHFSCVWLFVTPWTAAHQAPLSMGSLQARILEWVAVPSSRGPSLPRDCSSRGILYHWATRKPPLPQDNSEERSEFQSFSTGSAEALDDTEWKSYFALCLILQMLILRVLPDKLSYASLHFRVSCLGKLETGVDASCCPGEPDLPLSLPEKLISVCMATASHCLLLYPALRLGWLLGGTVVKESLVNLVFSSPS